ncbi:MAG: hypothetical protein WBS24_14300 [Terriglobales bacterium]
MTGAHRKIARRGHYRRILFVFVGLYIACFDWIYIHYLYPTFDYLGFEFFRPAPEYLALAWALALLPCLWMPIELTRPSQLAYWVLYISVFIPSMFVPLYAQMEPATEIAGLMLVFLLGFFIVGSVYWLPLASHRGGRYASRRIVNGLAILGGALALWLLAVYRDRLQFVSFNDVYDLRVAASDLAEGTSINYAFMPLTGAINPFFMGYGLFHRKRWMIAAGVAGQLLIYSVGGTKGSILSIVFIPGMYALLRMRRIPFGSKIAAASLALMLGFCLLYATTGEQAGTIVSLALFVVFSRTLGMGGLLTAQYYDFFQRNPFTYWSHIKGVSWFVHYPYQFSVGQELGISFAGTTALDATTHFFATDGLEAAGLPGVIAIAFFCAFVFWILDSAAQKHDPRLAALVTTYAAYNLSNISIFTSLLSGGLALLIAVFYFMKPEPAAA